jgi:hypothetical protein
VSAGPLTPDDALSRLIRAADECEFNQILAVMIDRWVEENPDASMVELLARMVRAVELRRQM